MKRHILTLIVVLLAVNLVAQNNNVLTLDSCFALAKANNAELKISHLEIQQAQEVKAQAFTKYFPQVSAGVMGYYAVNPLIRFGVDDVTNEAVRELLKAIIDAFQPATGFNGEFSLMKTGTSANVIIGQPVYMGGRIVNGNKLANVGIEAAELKAQVTEREILENVETTYYLVLGLQRKVKTVETALALLDTLEHTVSVAYSAGLVTQNDALRVELERNNMLATQLQLTNGIHLALRLLCQQIGIELPDDGLTLEFDKDEVNKANESLASFIRPEVQLLEIQVEAEKLRKKMTIGETLPNVIVGGWGFYGNMVKKNFRGNGVLFAKLSIPLTQWWETSHKIKEHNFKIEQYEIDRQNLTEKMSIQEEQAYTKMIEAEALLRVDSSSYAKAVENYRIESVNYNAGLNTISDVLQANTLLLQADNAITDRNILLLSAKRRYHDLTGK